MAEMSVGYSREDKEVETFTNPGIAVITAPSDIQVRYLFIKKRVSYIDIARCRIKRHKGILLYLMLLKTALHLYCLYVNQLFKQ